MKLSRLLVDIDVCQYAVWELSTFMLVVINCLHLRVYQRLVLLLHGFALTDVNLSCSCFFFIEYNLTLICNAQLVGIVQHFMVTLS